MGVSISVSSFVRASVLFVLVSVSAAAHSGGFTTDRFDVNVSLAPDRTTTVIDTITVNDLNPRAQMVLTAPSEDFKLTSAEVSLDGRQFVPTRADTTQTNGVWSCYFGGQMGVGKLTFRVTYRCQEGFGLDSKTGVYTWDLLPSAWPSAIEAGKVVLEIPDSEWVTMAEFDELKNGVHNMFAISNNFGESAHNDLFQVTSVDYQRWELDLKSPFLPGAALTAKVHTRMGTVDADPLKARPLNPFDRQRALPKSIVWTILASPVVLAALAVAWIRATNRSR